MCSCSLTNRLRRKRANRNANETRLLFPLRSHPSIRCKANLSRKRIRFRCIADTGSASLLGVLFSRGRLGMYIRDMRRVKSEEGRQSIKGEVVSRAKFQNGCCMHQIAHYTGFVPSDSNRGWHSRRFPMGSSIPLYFLCSPLSRASHRSFVD